MTCVCGCGETVRDGAQYAHGHNRRGVKCSPETIARRHAAWGAVSPMSGKKHSVATRARMSSVVRKKRGPSSPEHRAKIAAALRGKSRGGRGRNLQNALAYSLRTRDQRAKRTRQWAKTHPERRAINEARRRAQKRGSGGSGVSYEDWMAVRRDFSDRCAYCAAIRSLAMDHLDPLSKGGVHDIENIVPSCQSCNSSKHDHSLIVWLARQAARRV